ncbi:hypothetical protein [Pendulispora albinea]|uniref:Uncharacterized protein n=1 Tax=Pendulispora albinea TaxID=2741071 RepID=A0ABZ2LVC8_9BACT
MATDNSPPRTRLILVMAVATAVTLFVLKFILDSYFTTMWEGEANAKIPPALELAKLHEEENKKLTGSPIPIDKAISELASKGRESSALIAPQPSSDDGPLVGSSLLAKKGGSAAASPESAAPAQDASTTTTTAAPANANKGDAGAPHAGGAAGGATGGAAPGAADAGHPH